MVPLKLDLCDDCSRVPVSRPQLVMKDLTQERAMPRRSRQSSAAKLENAVLAAAAVAAFGFFFISSAVPMIRSVTQSYDSQMFPKSIVISKTVARGDTLAGLAYRYGDPNTYILEREDQIARANHLRGAAPLLPGQHLRIAVSNPTVIAQIARTSRHPLVASR